jgi:hypothetical protein
MSSAKEFRKYADECMGWAKTARSNQEREIFLQMARTWMQAAVLARDAPAQPEQKRTDVADDNKGGNATL